jgi:hypothetical protein
MRSRVATAAAALAALLTAFAPGCEPGIDPDGDGAAGVPDDDPLAVPSDLDPASLDALHRDVFVKSCAAQENLCHHGQFEPNLSTPALAYENLVRRPGIERDGQYRVLPGDPADSLLVDKLRNRDVVSQMPLGAHPLPEAQLAAIEAWITGGALRRPGAPPAPEMNNPPAEPQIAVLDAQGNRLDTTGPVAVTAGTTLVFRHSAQDFETAAEDIPYSAFFLELADGRELLVGEDPGDPSAGRSVHEPEGAPMGNGDLLDFRFEWTVPETVAVAGFDGSITEESTAGMRITVIAVYTDAGGPGDAMLTFGFEPDLVEVLP